jgi:hypothetical protein
MARARGRERGKGPVTWETVRAIAGALPGAVEGTSYGTPAFHVRKTLFVRLHQGGNALVVRIGEADRAMRMRADPETFYITEHYRQYPWILVRLATVDPADLADLVTDAWRLGAPKKLIDEHDGGGGG